MTGSKPRLTLPSDQVTAWKERRAELQDLIDEASGEMAAIDKLLEGVSLLAAARAEDEPVHIIRKPANGAPNVLVPVGETLINAIDRIVGTDAPIDRPHIKTRLASEGFPAERLENYFYTCVMRLKKRGKIIEDDQGRLSRAH